jgi:hypothetical protein
VKNLIFVIVCYLAAAVFLVMVVTYGVPAVGQEFPGKTQIQAGCFVSWETGQCQEPTEFYWSHFGRTNNEYLYGKPVGDLLTAVVRWQRYAEDLEARNRRLRAKVKKYGRNSGT